MNNAGTIKAPVDASAPTSPSNSPGSHWRQRVTITSVLIVLIAAAVVLPPLINVGRYQRQVTTLVARSLGRPVQLSSVGLQLLPRPGFILHDLSVAEDPAIGAEPILTARTVVASIAVASLWRGKMAIARVSVDEASFNLVQTPDGRWNLESLMMGAQPSLAESSSGKAQTHSGNPSGFPYLEATNSRVNFKHGLEKSPFSVLNTDLSFWQENPGQWRVRLRGQPVRTDIEMSWADTGEVRLEASLQAAAQLRDMPLQLQIEWRDAHLGQLSRLVFGSDAGWRGDLTANIDVQGTANDAHVKTRLRATGVRREEFAPETPLDLDANCSFVYQHSEMAFRNILCDSALGSGQLHLKAELPGNSQPPAAMLEVKQVPVQAFLDLLRTVRGGFAPGISARGSANGSLTYKIVPASLAIPPSRTVAHTPRTVSARFKRPASPVVKATAGNLQGAIVLTGIILKGGELKEPLAVPPMTWVPVADSSGMTTALETHVTEQFPSTSAASFRSSPVLPPSAPTSTSVAAQPANPATTPSDSNPQAPDSQPDSNKVARTVNPSTPAASAVAFKFNVGPSGYSVAATGSTAIERLRDLAYAFGLSHSDALDAFSGGSPELNLSAAGPWMVPFKAESIAVNSARTPAAIAPTTDAANGTVLLRHTVWKPYYLPRPAYLDQLTVTLSGSTIAMTSDFAYGGSKDASPGEDALRGKVTIQDAPVCQGAECAPPIQLHLGALDAYAVQAALLGSQPPTASLMDKVRERIRSSNKPAWPALTFQVTADSLNLGQATLRKPTATVKLGNQGDFELSSWSTELLGGTASGTGSLQWTAEAPEYAFEGTFENLSAVAVGALMGSRMTGSPIGGSGKVKLSGLDWKILAASASGDVQFTWPGGSLTSASGPPLRFQNWAGSLSIQAGKAQLTSNIMTAGKRTIAVAGAIPFGSEAKLAITSTTDQLASHTQTSPSNPGKAPR